MTTHSRLWIRRSMRRPRAAVAAAALLAVTGGGARADKMTPELHEMMKHVSADERLPVIIRMATQADLEAVIEGRRTKAERLAAVVGALESVADATQNVDAGGCARPSLHRELRRAETAGRAADIRSHWLVNAMSVRATADVIAAAAARDDVALVAYDPRRPVADGSRVVATAQDNVAAVRAPLVWDGLGVTGAGALVGLIGPGADASHPDLSAVCVGGAMDGASCSDGGAAACTTATPPGRCVGPVLRAPGSSLAGKPYFWDAVARTTPPVPFDDHGLGTFLLGVAVGRNGSGVAPHANWIACRGMQPVDDDGDGVPDDADGNGIPDLDIEETDVIACAEWLLNPSGRRNQAGAPDPDPALVPDVVLLPSLALTRAPGVCDDGPRPDSYRLMIQHLRRAGVLAVLGIGESADPEADAGGLGVPSPANFPESFSVGAADHRDPERPMLANSYRGVADCVPAGVCVCGTGCVPPPGVACVEPLPAPRVLAPGRDVTGPWIGGGTAGAYRTLSGTDVAAAHVAGAAALLASAHRDDAALPVEIVDDALRRSACPRPACGPSDECPPVACAPDRPAFLDVLAAVTFQDATFVEQTPPPDQSVTDNPVAVTVKMRNTGVTTWRPGVHRLRGLFGAWTPGTVTEWVEPLDGARAARPVLPGELAVFSWQAFAPHLPGDYSFRWRMEDTTLAASFGQSSARRIVPVAGTDLPVYQGRSPAFASLVPGECRVTLFTFRNAGTNTWIPGTYVLREADATGWAPYGQADLFNITRPGEVAYFTTQVCAPTASGHYDFQWLLVKNGASLGTYTPNERIGVFCTNASEIVSFVPPPAEMRAGTTATVSLTLRNGGTCAWRFGHCLRSPHGAFWSTPTACLGWTEAVAPGQTRTFVLPVTAPDGRQRAPLGFQMTAPDGIPFGAVAATTIGIPWDFQGSTTWVPGVQGGNYWFYRFRLLGSELWRKLPWDGHDWSDQLWADHAHPYSVPVGRFWKSPVAGWVRVGGGAQRRHPQACGNGVTVRLKLNDNATLQTFDIPQNDWSWHPFTAAPFWVNVNDTIRFIVDRRGSNHDCDNTTLDPLVQVLPPATVGPIPTPVAVANLYDEP